MGSGKGTVGGFLRELAVLGDGRTKRVSSWDRTGGNNDRITIPPGKTAVLADLRGAGCITHIWVTINCLDRLHLRKILLRMFWDGEAEPSVEVPLGDFFGLGHAKNRNFAFLLFAMNPRDGRAMNCYFPMPFSDGARVEAVNECEVPVDAFYYYVDYEEYDGPEEGLGRFHAQWRRENPCRGVRLPEGRNLTGEENYVILEAEGRGHYVGCVLNVDSEAGGWYGEGDDMIFIDGEGWPPSLHGTGTEDYFCGAWSPDEEYWGLYSGLPLAGRPRYLGKTSMYRLHVADPVRFRRSIRVTIEHGHANNRSDDYSSTAYWYQTEPHKPFPKIPPAEQRIPRMPPEFYEAEKKERAVRRRFFEAVRGPPRLPPAEVERLRSLMRQVDSAMMQEDYRRAMEVLDQLTEALKGRGE